MRDGKGPETWLFSLILMKLKLDLGHFELLDSYGVVRGEKMPNEAGSCLGWQPCRALHVKQDSHLEIRSEWI